MLVDCGAGAVFRMAQLGIDWRTITHLALTHFHADHTGQLGALKNATLLIGKGDWDGITATPPMGGANVKGFEAWIAEKRKVETQTGDKDWYSFCRGDAASAGAAPASGCACCAELASPGLLLTTITWPHFLHRILNALPLTFSSAIWYFVVQLSQTIFMLKVFPLRAVRGSY